MDLNILLFNDFETLDAFGPVEILGRISEYRLRRKGFFNDEKAEGFSCTICQQWNNTGLSGIS